MTIFEFFALFSFSFIVFIFISTFVLGFVASRKKKKVVKDMEDLVVGLRGFNNDLIGADNEIKEDN